MDDTALKQAIEQLFPFGWKISEIRRLNRFCETYVHTYMDQADLDKRHLEFIRWLVHTGRLTR